MHVLNFRLPNMGNYFCLFIINIFKVIAVCVQSTISIRVSILLTITMILIAIVLLTIIRLSWVHGLVMYNMCYTIYIHVFHNSFVTRIERELVVFRRRCPHQSEQFVQPPYIALPPSSCSLACLTLLFYIMCYNFQRFKVSPPSSWGSTCALLVSWYVCLGGASRYICTKGKCLLTLPFHLPCSLLMCMKATSKSYLIHLVQSVLVINSSPLSGQRAPL